MKYEIKKINPEEDSRWDDYVQTHPDGTIYHHSLWGKVLTESFAYSLFYLALENMDTHRLEGIVPIMLISSRRAGKRLVSLPMTTSCDCLIPEEFLPDIVNYIIRLLPDLDYIEFKLPRKLSTAVNLFDEKCLYVDHSINLDIEPKQFFSSVFNENMRRMIRKADANHLNYRVADSLEDLNHFYKLEVAVRKRHGLPPHPISFFRNMWRFLKFQDMLFVPIIEFQGKIIAAEIVLKFKDVFYSEYSASDSKYFKSGVNQKLFWELIQIGYRNGIKKINLGRSSRTHQSLIYFKESWGAKPNLLYYYYNPKSPKVENDNNLMYKTMQWINKKLPEKLLILEGKMIYRHYG